MSEKEIDAMVYNKHLDIIKGVVAPAIMTENYLQAYREGIKDTLRKMMKDSVDYRVQVNGMSERYIVIHNPIINDNTLNEGDHVKLIIIKDDQI